MHLLQLCQQNQQGYQNTTNFTVCLQLAFNEKDKIDAWHHRWGDRYADETKLGLEEVQLDSQEIQDCEPAEEC